MTLYLHVIDGMGPRQVFRLDDPSTLRVGRRHDCDILLQDRSVSRDHCFLNVSEGRVHVEDNSSRNGTWIHSQRLVGRTEIKPGDRIQLAGARLELEADAHIDEVAYQSTQSPSRLTHFLPAFGGTRKLRLLACAWIRNLGINHEAVLRLIEVAELYADGKRTAGELILARDCAAVSAVEAFRHPLMLPAVGDPSPRAAVQGILRCLGTNLGDSPLAEQIMQLTRDVLGDFFSPFRALPEWLCWNDRTVWKMARAIYEERSFEDMPILADALEEAGCSDEHVLHHCRMNARHTRGCWVLDPLLGKR